MVNKDTEGCLRVFALTLGNRWANHYVSILRFGLTEGVDLSLNLQELIGDYEKGTSYGSGRRNRLVGNSYFNFSPIVFLIVVLGHQYRRMRTAYAYYEVSAVGRDMLLDWIILIGASFLMGIYLSMRRM